MDQNIDFSGSDKIQTPQYPEIHPPSQEISDKVFQAKGDLMKSIQTFLEEFNYIPFGEKPKILLQDWDNFFAIQYAQLEDSNELFQKLLEDLQIINKELIGCNRPIFFNDNEDHSNFRVIHKSSTSLKNTSQISPVHAVAPILSTKEPEYSPSMGYEHPNTTPEIESDEIIKSDVKELVPIPNENEVISEDKRECDVLICENSLICDDHSEIFFDSNNDDDISSDDDAFEDIEYVEVSLPDPEIVSLEEENVVDQEEEEFDLEEIQDVVLREKLLSINHLIANIVSLNDNLTPDCVLNSFASIPIFEEFDNLSRIILHRIRNFLRSYGRDEKWDIRFLEELLIDDSIPFPINEESDFDNPSFPRPLSEPPDAEFDLEPDAGEEISVVMNDNDKLECLDPRDEIDENYYYFPFMFVIRIFLPYLICSKMFLSFLSAESEDTIFDPGISV
nr:hypothetical protein [Tanacetum cinerariifolium]